MSDLLSVSTAARELSEQLGWDVSPRCITLLFYYRDLADDRAPVVSGRRVIERDLLPDIARALRRRGWTGRHRSGVADVQ